MKTRIGMLLWLLLCGCSSNTVRCDARLQPINAPASHSTAAAKSGA
jgi:hypothetical protein